MRKENIRILYLLLFIGLPLSMKGQQIPLFSLANSMPVFYNPAMAGIDNETRLFTDYRQQWSGFTGAPETFILGIEGRFNEKTAAALTLYNDISSIYSQLAGYATYSYKIKINEKNILYVGLSAGLKQNRIYFNKIEAESPNEQSLLDYTEKETRFDAGAGLTYQYKQLQIQVSALQITNQGYQYQQQSEFKTYNYQLIDHLFLNAGYTFEFSKQKILLTPIISARNVQGTPLQLDAAITTEYEQRVALTTGYRQSSNFYASLRVYVWDNISIAYAYEMPGNDFKGLTSGSHEVMLSYKLNRGAGHAGNERISDREWKQMKQQNQQLFQQTEQLQLENEQLVKQLAQHDSLVTGQTAELNRLKEIFENSKVELQSVRSRYEINLSELDSVNAEDTLSKVKPKNYYIILGAYLTLADAKFFQKVLEREIGLQTLVFTREDGKYFFVYSAQVHNKDELNRELRHLKRAKADNYINGNVWIYGDK